MDDEESQRMRKGVADCEWGKGLTSAVGKGNVNITGAPLGSLPWLGPCFNCQKWGEGEE